MDGPDQNQGGETQDLFSAVYDELRRLAGSWWRDQQPGQTLQPTALVHEAYLKLAGGESRAHDEHHFRALAARAMRQALIQHARGKGRLKRGGDRSRVSLDEFQASGAMDIDAALAVEEALAELETMNERHARIVEMRFFAGMTESEMAGVLGVSDRTVRSEWRLARAWLAYRLSGERSDGR